MTTATVVGRARELASVSTLLEDALPSPRGLVLEGEPGIGKTTLWREAVRLARARGTRVFIAQPAESERSMSYTALTDLLQDVALSGEAQDLLQRSLAAEDVDQAALSRAVLDVFRDLSNAMPFLIAVDDAQWLDAPSEAVLTFVLRRLPEHAARVVVTQRSTGPTAVPLELDRAFDARLERVSVGPISLADLGRLIHERLGFRLSGVRLDKLHRAAGGNPFYALEIARTLDPDARDDDVPVPAHLGAVVEARLDALHEVARDSALLTSACLQPTTAVVERAGGGPEGIAAAVEAGVLQIDRSRLRFTHPLLASVAYESAPPWTRRDAHARLAGVTTGLERAHHLARSTDEPDEELAVEIYAAADSARRSGAAALAADLADHALRLTTADSPHRFDRALDAAWRHVTAGDPPGAKTRLAELVDSLPRGPQRAIALAHLANLSNDESVPDLGARALEEADNPRFEVQIHLMIAVYHWNVGALERSIQHARSAVSLAEEIDDPQLLSMALGESVEQETQHGRPVDEAAILRLLELERRSEYGMSSFIRPSLKVANIFYLTDRLDEARALLENELRRVEAEGDDAIRWGIHARLSDIELRAGNLATALRHAQAAIDARQFGEEPHPFALVPYARVLAILGDLGSAREAATRALAAAEETRNTMLAARARSILGFAALADGDVTESWRILDSVITDIQQMGVGELSFFGGVETALEAAVAAGAIDEAERISAWVEESGRATGRPWNRAVAARGRAMVAAERGDVAAARAHITDALAAHASLPVPFEHARTLLVQGRIERRGKNRRAARDALTRALELFDEMGAAPFAEIAASELARIPGRAPGTGDLTETERRVAELVAKGSSNKEIAAQLFITVRTVEANLTRIYAKLGVRSRTELASRLGG